MFDVPDLGEITSFIKSFENVALSHKFGKKIDVYDLGSEMFCLLDRDKKPARISLRCDKNLSTEL